VKWRVPLAAAGILGATLFLGSARLSNAVAQMLPLDD
jgi:hypothetical protein